jgi:3-oxo-5-alpha-steroid 4-dehydrogenase 3
VLVGFGLVKIRVLLLWHCFTFLATLLEKSFDFSHFTIEPPSLRTFVGCLIFILASGVQHDCHAYLASLKKYSVPEHPVFSRLVCPHYFVECLIYLAISIVAAPAGAILNWTIVCALIFVAVNLGVTADGTREWYVQKFGPDSMSGKWRMIPFVFWWISQKRCDRRLGVSGIE